MRFDPSIVTVGVVTQNLFYNYFENLITGRLIEGGRLIGDRFMEDVLTWLVG